MKFLATVIGFPQENLGRSPSLSRNDGDRGTLGQARLASCTTSTNSSHAIDIDESRCNSMIKYDTKYEKIWNIYIFIYIVRKYTVYILHIMVKASKGCDIYHPTPSNTALCVCCMSYVKVHCIFSRAFIIDFEFWAEGSHLQCPPHSLKTRLGLAE